MEKEGIFFDVGESWTDLEDVFNKDRYGTFLANEEFLYALKDHGVKSIELVTELGKPLTPSGKTTINLLDWLDEFNKTDYIPWDKMSYGQMEALALETSPLFERTTDTIWNFK